jgi:predicted ATPase
VAAQAAEIKLDCFDGQEAERLIRNVSANKPMPPEVVREIQRRSSGNPLFLEQITRSVIDSNLRMLGPLAWRRR